MLSQAKARGANLIPPRMNADKYHEGMNLTIELDREEDGRWIAEALELPGVMC